MNVPADQCLDLVGLADVTLTAFLGIVGLYLVHSIRRQQTLRVAEKRLTAYQALWSRMTSASPVRLAKWKAEPLSQTERELLFDSLVAWYYEDGNGMFLGDNTRSIYLKCKDNLICELESYEPESIRRKLSGLSLPDQERARGYLSIRQLSLLRNRMKADLGVFGIPYHVTLNELDIAFLLACGENTQSKPWNRAGQMADDVGQSVEIFPVM